MFNVGFILKCFIWFALVVPPLAPRQTIIHPFSVALILIGVTGKLETIPLGFEYEAESGLRCIKGHMREKNNTAI